LLASSDRTRWDDSTFLDHQASAFPCGQAKLLQASRSTPKLRTERSPSSSSRAERSNRCRAARRRADVRVLLTYDLQRIGGAASSIPFQHRRAQACGSSQRGRRARGTAARQSVLGASAMLRCVKKTILCKSIVRERRLMISFWICWKSLSLKTKVRPQLSTSFHVNESSSHSTRSPSGSTLTIERIAYIQSGRPA